MINKKQRKKEVQIKIKSLLHKLHQNQDVSDKLITISAIKLSPVLYLHFKLKHNPIPVPDTWKSNKNKWFSKGKIEYKEPINLLTGDKIDKPTDSLVFYDGTSVFFKKQIDKTCIGESLKNAIEKDQIKILQQNVLPESVKFVSQNTNPLLKKYNFK